MKTDSRIVRLFFRLVAPLLSANIDYPIRKGVALYHLLILPFHWVAHKAQGVIRSKRFTKCSLGAVIGLAGAFMATHPVEYVPHFLWDGLAYGLHGYGALPFIKLGCKFLDLEDIA
jgi:hypothetical protein